MPVRTAAVSQFVVPAFGGSNTGRGAWLRSSFASQAKASSPAAQPATAAPSVLPNPSLHLTGYSGLRPLPPAGELQR